MTIDPDTVALLGAYLDRELSPGEALAMERRLAAEPALRELADRLAALSSATQEALTMPPASVALRARVVRQLGTAEPEPRRSRWLARQPLAAALAAGLCLGGLIGGGAGYWLSPAPRSATETAVLAGHLRGLAVAQPFDVASSDRHVVKPWFDGRTTIAPEAIDLADQGFPLLGGRIDVVDGRPVPTLVYRADRHVVSVTVVPRAAGESARDDQRDGYRIDRRPIGDLTYWFVSDMDAAPLSAFAHLFEERLVSAR